MKLAIILSKVIVTILAYMISANIAKYISMDIMGKIAISQTYFFALFLPMTTSIWMKYTNTKLKMIRLGLAVSISSIAIIAMTMISYSIGHKNPSLASQIFGAQIIVLIIIYVWLWSSLKSLTLRVTANIIGSEDEARE